MPGLRLDCDALTRAGPFAECAESIARRSLAAAATSTTRARNAAAAVVLVDDQARDGERVSVARPSRTTSCVFSPGWI
jgi:hypothetical protein